MSLRPIEVQGSFTISQKTGKLQEQLQQRGQVSQDVMGQQQTEEDRRLKQQVNEMKFSEQTRFHKEGGSKKEQEQEKKQSDKDENEIDPETKHPFKGKFIDFSG